MSSIYDFFFLGSLVLLLLSATSLSLSILKSFKDRNNFSNKFEASPMGKSHRPRELETITNGYKISKPVTSKTVGELLASKNR